jgi:hypothetical protein
MIEILIGVLAALPIIGLIQVSVFVHRWNSERLCHHREQFFAIAERLLQKDELDDERLLRLQKMNRDICSQAAFQPLMDAATQLEQERRKGIFRPAVVTFPAEWAELVYSYFLAVSHTRAVRGILLRAQLFSLVDPLSATYSSDAIDRRVHAPQLTPVPA